MFDELYAPLPSVQAYLERIGLNTAGKDKAALDGLILAHRRAVPFENLDIFDLGLRPSLGTRDLFDKIVVRRRGGYCFELNALFAALLRALGYDYYAVAVRVFKPGFNRLLLTHRANIVRLDGRLWFCDVGFGGLSPERALDLETGGDGFGFRREGREIHMDYQGAPVLIFPPEPFEEVDFLSLNEYQTHNPAAYFKNHRVVNLLTEDGSLALTDNTLRIRKGGTLTEKEVSDAELPAVLEKYFGIIL